MLQIYATLRLVLKAHHTYLQQQKVALNSGRCCCYIHLPSPRRLLIADHFHSIFSSLVCSFFARTRRLDDDWNLRNEHAISQHAQPNLDNKRNAQHPNRPILRWCLHSRSKYWIRAYFNLHSVYPLQPSLLRVNFRRQHDIIYSRHDVSWLVND